MHLASDMPISFPWSHLFQVAFQIRLYEGSNVSNKLKFFELSDFKTGLFDLPWTINMFQRKAIITVVFLSQVGLSLYG